MHKNETSSHIHTLTHARTKTRQGIHNSKHPAPLGEQPPTTGKASPTRANAAHFQEPKWSQTPSSLPPASESHEMQKGRATGGPPPSPGRAHRPLGQSCEQPRRCQPAHSGSRARRGERTIVAAAALGGGGAAAEAARRVPGPCPQLPAAAAAEIWLSYYSPPSTGCECVCARV